MQDTIRRYGGSTAPSMPWPEEEERRYDTQTEEERFDRLEKLLRKSSKKQRQSLAVRESDQGSQAVMAWFMMLAYRLVAPGKLREVAGLVRFHRFG